MYVTHTFLSKTNTIVRGENENLSLNPIMELSYGGITTRGLIYFDVTNLKALYTDKVYPYLDNLTHKLKMFNAGSINEKGINKCFPDQKRIEDRERAVSFDLIFFKIPQSWDAGRGFDYTQDMYYGKHRGYSEYGSNWFNSATGTEWKGYVYVKYDGPIDGETFDENNTFSSLTEAPIYEAENMNNPNYFRVGNDGWVYYRRHLMPNYGIYSVEKLKYELEKYNSETGSDIIVGVQHFDYGNESIELDLTCLVNEWIAERETSTNFGIGIAFAPCLEETCTKHTQYVGFFTNHTNSFFEPYIETVYNDRVIDDRANFYLDKTNRLYFHSIIGGKHVNLDDNPTCTINGTQMVATQAGKGLYYTEIEMSHDNTEPDTMYYDVWSDIKYGAKTLPNVEKFFTTKSQFGYYNFGCDTTDSEYKKIVPNVYGIKNGEKLHRDGVIKVNVEYVIKYTKKQETGVYDSLYRLYSKQGEKEITVIDWQPTHCDYITNYFFLDTKSLVPGNYFVDIKCINDFEETVHKKTLEFEIVNDATEVKC